MKKSIRISIISLLGVAGALSITGSIYFLATGAPLNFESKLNYRNVLSSNEYFYCVYYRDEKTFTVRDDNRKIRDYLLTMTWEESHTYESSANVLYMYYPEYNIQINCTNRECLIEWDPKEADYFISTEYHKYYKITFGDLDELMNIVKNNLITGYGEQIWRLKKQT